MRPIPAAAATLMLLTGACAPGDDSAATAEAGAGAVDSVPEMVTGTTGAPGPGTVGTPGTPGATDPDTIRPAADSTPP
jgi:hypothetical protein